MGSTCDTRDEVPCEKAASFELCCPLAEGLDFSAIGNYVRWYAFPVTVQSAQNGDWRAGGPRRPEVSSRGTGYARTGASAEALRPAECGDSCTRGSGPDRAGLPRRLCAPLSSTGSNRART